MPACLRACSHASLLVPTPAIWAAAALRQIGRETCCTPYWFHALLVSCVMG